MSDYATCAATGSIEVPTIEGIQKIMADFERRWPASERAVAIEAPPSTQELITYACDQLFPIKDGSTLSRGLNRLPVYTNLEVPFHCYIIRMADGSQVMHYRDGRKVRCLPGAPQ